MTILILLPLSLSAFQAPGVPFPFPPRQPERSPLISIHCTIIVIFFVIVFICIAIIIFDVVIITQLLPLSIQCNVVVAIVIICIANVVIIRSVASSSPSEPDVLPSFLFLAGGRPASRLAAGSDHCNILFLLHSDLDHADVDDACKYLSVGC